MHDTINNYFKINEWLSIPILLVLIDFFLYYFFFIQNFGYHIYLYAKEGIFFIRIYNKKFKKMLNIFKVKCQSNVFTMLGMNKNYLNK